MNGWDKGVLQNAVDKCHCNPYGDVCVSRKSEGFLNIDHSISPHVVLLPASSRSIMAKHAALPRLLTNKVLPSHILSSDCNVTFGLAATGLLAKLPGNNPVTGQGARAPTLSDPNVPRFISPIYAYTGATPTATGTPVGAPPAAPTLPPPAKAGPATASPTAPAPKGTPVLVGSPNTKPGSTCKSKRDLPIRQLGASRIHHARRHYGVSGNIF
jgi:hypothetical protein